MSLVEPETMLEIQDRIHRSFRSQMCIFISTHYDMDQFIFFTAREVIALV